jgi:hypothetical protein
MLQDKKSAKGEQTLVQLKPLLQAAQNQGAKIKWSYQTFVGASSMLLLQNIDKVITVEVWIGRHP